MDPVPYFNEDYWKTQAIINLLGNNSFEMGPCRATSWVACVGYWSEPFSPICGYPVIFPTVSDCLLWFRWLVLGYETGHDDQLQAGTVQLDGFFREIADEIDLAIMGSRLSSREILQTGLQRLQGRYKDLRFWVDSINSIHDFMLERGTLKLWREVLRDESIDFANGQFLISNDGWGSVLDYVYHELIDCDAYLPGYEDP